jgi:hypothetical protein
MIVRRVTSVAPFDTQYRAKYAHYTKEPGKILHRVELKTIMTDDLLFLVFKENLRSRLLVDIGNILGKLTCQ